MPKDPVPGAGGGSLPDLPGSHRRRANMREVADRAGVAISSVSRVLSSHPDVSGEMRDRVLSAVHALGYEPDFLAQSLRRGATRSIGFVVGDISNPVMADITSGAESVLRAAGYSMLLMNSESRAELEATHIRFLATRRVDGMLLTLSSEQYAGTIDAIRTLDVPVVLVDRDLPGDIGASAVIVDHATGMSAAVNHLLDLGHRRMALITGSTEIRPVMVRISAVRDTVQRRAVGAQVIESTGTLNAEHGEAATFGLLLKPDPPTAIIAGGNQLLVGCLRAIAKLGLRVGSDLSLVSCDEVPLVEFHDPPISCVTRDTREMGRKVATLMLRRLSGVSGPETVVLPTDYVARSSCAPPALPRPRVAAG